MKLLNRIDNYTSASFVLVWIAFLLSIRARPSPQMISKIEKEKSRFVLKKIRCRRFYVYTRTVGQSADASARTFSNRLDEFHDKDGQPCNR